MKNKNEVDMTSGNLFAKLFIVSLPLIFSGILQLLYNAADLIVCGLFGSGEHAVGAISSTNPLINLIINMFLGLSTGANVLMARCFGERNQEKGQRVLYTSLIFGFVSGIIISIIGLSCARLFLEWMKSSPDIIDLSDLYLSIYFIGVPCSMIYNFGSSVLRAIGDTKRPFIILGFSGIFNVLLNLFFVICFHMDVAGVAWATIISQAISAVLIVICLIRNKGFITLKIKQLRFYKKEALEIVKIGIPAGIQGTIFSLSNVLIQSSVNSLGTNAMDGNGAAASLEGFIYVAMNSVAASCVAFVSANYGALKFDNIKKVVIYSSIIVILMNIVFGGLVLLLQDQLLRLYINSDDEQYVLDAITMAKERLVIISCTYFTCGLMDTFAYSLRGIGYSITPMIVTLIGACGLRILWIYTAFNLEQFHSIAGLAWSYPISWVITLLTFIILFIILFKRVKKTHSLNLNIQ